MRAKRLVVIVLLICFVLLPKSNGAEGGDSGTKTTGEVKFPGEIDPLPPYLADAQYLESYLPGSNETYELTLEPVDPKRKRLTEAWLHRIVSRIPGRTNEERREFAARLGFVGVPKERGKSWHFTNETAWLSLDTDGPDGRGLGYTCDADYWNQVNYYYVEYRMSREEYVALWKDVATSNLFIMGRAEMREMGVWPENADKWWDIYFQEEQHDKWPGDLCIINKTFHVTGTLAGDHEQFEILQKRNYIKMTVLCNGKIRSFEMRWAKPERYALVKIKSIEQAFDELNRGYGQALL